MSGCFIWCFYCCCLYISFVVVIFSCLATTTKIDSANSSVIRGANLVTFIKKTTHNNNKNYMTKLAYSILKKWTYLMRCGCKLFNFSLTCKRFHLVSLSYKAYRERLALSHEVFGSDPNTCYEFMKKCLDEVSENICLGFSGLLKSRKYLKSILNIKLKKDI